MRRLCNAILVIVFMAMVFPINAFAYLDPSAMTYVIQAIAGVVIAGGAAIAIYWKKIKLYFKKKTKKNK